MKLKPLVSIVTPSYNQDAFLEETILSVLNQRYPHIEYIIMDGASNDGSVDIIKKYQDRISIWKSEKDRGQTDAINKGFSLADGEILAWLNSDDTYLPSAVEEAVEFLLKNPEIGMVYGDANYVNAESRIIGKFPSAQTDLKKLRAGYVHIPQQASFFRRSVWDKVGPLDPDFYFAMDYDLWVRIASITTLRHHPVTWANFRLHSKGKTVSADDQCWPEMLKVHFRDGGTHLAPIVFKYYLRKMAAPIIRWRRNKLINSSNQN